MKNKLSLIEVIKLCTSLKGYLLHANLFWKCLAIPVCNEFALVSEFFVVLTSDYLYTQLAQISKML